MGSYGTSWLELAWVTDFFDNCVCHGSCSYWSKWPHKEDYILNSSDSVECCRARHLKDCKDTLDRLILLYHLFQDARLSK